MMDDRTILYRFFNRRDELLYVGITKNMPQRMGAHQKTKPWNQVKTITLEHFEDRKLALAAEVDAIANEGPKWNLSPGHTHQFPDPDHADLTDTQKKLLTRMRMGRGLTYVVSQSDTTVRRAWVNDTPATAENILTVNALIRRGVIYRTQAKEVQNAIVSTWFPKKSPARRRTTGTKQTDRKTSNSPVSGV